MSREPVNFDDHKRLDGRFGEMVDFWRWAYADLKPNNVRGVFAEWMVAQILGLDPAPRDSWAEFDLQLPAPDNRKIEVKASAYRQSWHKPTDPPSAITFSGLKGQKWIEEERRYDGVSRYHADIYVFCIQTQKVVESWDAFDLDNWEFYVATRARIERRQAKSLGLSAVQSLAEGGRLRASQLRDAVYCLGT
jgi:hypothetical protein